MEPMVRKQLYLTRAQDRALKERARRERRSEAALVREAVDRLLDASADETTGALARLADEIVAEHPVEAPAAGEGRGWTRDELYADREARGGQ